MKIYVIASNEQDGIFMYKNSFGKIFAYTKKPKEKELEYKQCILTLTVTLKDTIDLYHILY